MTLLDNELHYCGIGLRFEHIDEVLSEKPKIPWLEVISDNFLKKDSVQQDYLFEIAEDYQLSLHGVGLSLGSTDPLDKTYLNSLKSLADRIKPLRISDHLCWTSSHGVHTHDLLPLPYNVETVNHISDRIKQVQDYLGTELVVENVSSYLEFELSDISEWEFIVAVLEKADCGILLDLNNIYVNAYNHGFSANEYLDNISMHRVREIHLAGHTNHKTHLLDTHSSPVSQDVWTLYQQLMSKYPAIPTLIEWDNDLPPLLRLIEEARTAEKILQDCKDCVEKAAYV